MFFLRNFRFSTGTGSTLLIWRSGNVKDNTKNKSPRQIKGKIMGVRAGDELIVH